MVNSGVFFQNIRADQCPRHRLVFLLLLDLDGRSGEHWSAQRFRSTLPDNCPMNLTVTYMFMMLRQ